MSSAVFISYRTANAATDAGLIAKELRRRIRPHRVCFDGGIRPGRNFADLIPKMIRQSGVMLLVIDSQWSVQGPESVQGRDDWVLKEIVTALEMEKIFLPVLVRGASIPADPPESVKAAFSHVAFRFGGDVTWSRDPEWGRLATEIKSLLDGLDDYDRKKGNCFALICAALGGFVALGILLWLLS